LKFLFGFPEKFRNSIIPDSGLVNKLNVAFKGVDNMQDCYLTGRSGKFIAAVLAAGAFDNSGFAKPVEDLFEELVRDVAARSNIFYLQEAGVVMFSKCQKCSNAVPAFVTNGEHEKIPDWFLVKVFLGLGYFYDIIIICSSTGCQTINAPYF